jgi:hypothetical protein
MKIPFSLSSHHACYYIVLLLLLLIICSKCAQIFFSLSFFWRKFSFLHTINKFHRSSSSSSDVRLICAREGLFFLSAQNRARPIFLARFQKSARKFQLKSALASISMGLVQLAHFQFDFSARALAVDFAYTELCFFQVLFFDSKETSAMHTAYLMNGWQS